MMRQEVIDYFEQHNGFFAMLAKVRERKLDEAKFKAAAQVVYDGLHNGNSNVLPVNYFREIQRVMRRVDASEFYRQQKLVKHYEAVVGELKERNMVLLQDVCWAKAKANAARLINDKQLKILVPLEDKLARYRKMLIGMSVVFVFSLVWLGGLLWQ
jgi:hypothetical protein